MKSLKETHGAVYSTEKLNILAHKLHIGKHDSIHQEKSSSWQKNVAQRSQTVDDMPIPSDPMPPRKRVSLRTECID